MEISRNCRNKVIESKVNLWIFLKTDMVNNSNGIIIYYLYLGRPKIALSDTRYISFLFREPMPNYQFGVNNI